MLNSFLKIVLIFGCLFSISPFNAGILNRSFDTYITTNSSVEHIEISNYKSYCSPISISHKDIKNEFSETEEEESHKVLNCNYYYKTARTVNTFIYTKFSSCFIPFSGKNQLYLLFRVFRI